MFRSFQLSRFVFDSSASRNVVDRVGMLLADSPVGGKMSDEGKAGDAMTRDIVATHARKHDSSGQGEKRTKGTSGFSHNHLLSSH